MKVRDKVLVVTGAGGGVGRELALQLLAKGASVAAVDINARALESMAAEAGSPDRLSLHTVNLTEENSVQNLVSEVLQAHPAVDGIINNAGVIQPFVPVRDLPLEKMDQVMKVNYYGTLYMVKAFLPELLLRPEAHITNVSSMGGFLPVPGQSAYGASKAAVRLLSEGLWIELRNTGVGVSVVIPGGIATDIMGNSGVRNNTGWDARSAGGFLLSPRKAARLIIRATEAGRFRSYLGLDCKIMHFLYTLFPRLSLRLINRVLGATLLKEQP